VTLSFTFSSFPVFAQTQQADWKDICARATADPLAAPAFTNGKPLSELKDCDSTRLYYGFSRAPDRKAALQCAYFERAHPRPSTGDPFYGVGVLSMLYANGFGIQRNYDLAIRFTCENTWAAQAEMEGRIRHLQHLRDSRSQTANFDLCDDGTSGLMEGACAEIGEQFAETKRAQKLKVLSAGWSREVKTAFENLQKAEQSFAMAHSGREIDLSGTGRGAFSIEAAAKVHDQFIQNLQRLAKGTVPPASAQDYRDVDANLNARYSQLLASKRKDEDQPRMGGEVELSGIRESERAWIKFRDGWMAFAPLANPKIEAKQIGALITGQRIEQFKDIE